MLPRKGEQLLSTRRRAVLSVAGPALLLNWGAFGGGRHPPLANGPLHRPAATTIPSVALEGAIAATTPLVPAYDHSGLINIGAERVQHQVVAAAPTTLTAPLTASVGVLPPKRRIMLVGMLAVISGAVVN